MNYQINLYMCTILVTSLTQRSTKAKLSLTHDVLNNHSNASNSRCSPVGGATPGLTSQTWSGQLAVFIC